MAGEIITVRVHPRPATRAEAESISLDVLYEDDDVIAHQQGRWHDRSRRRGNVSGTLVNALLGRGQALFAVRNRCGRESYIG